MFAKQILYASAVVALTVGQVQAAPKDLCRESYGKTMRSRSGRARAHYRGMLAGAGMYFAAGSAAVFDYFEPSFLKLPVRPYKIAAGVFGLSLAFFTLEARTAYRDGVMAIFNEVIGHAMDEAQLREVGPATLTLTDFLRSTVSEQPRNNGSYLFDQFKLDRSNFANLDEGYDLGGPRSGQVQAALRWMRRLGLLCYADQTSLQVNEFARRFEYALNLVAENPAMELR